MRMVLAISTLSRLAKDVTAGKSVARLCIHLKSQDVHPGRPSSVDGERNYAC